MRPSASTGCSPGPMPIDTAAIAACVRLVTLELAEDRGQVRLHGLLRQEQRARDVSVAPALGQEREDVGLALA